MKRILALLLAIAMLPIMALPVLAAEEAAAADAASNPGTMMENGSIIVPVRKLCEGLGAKVDWNFNTEVATVTLGENTIKLKEGQETANVNGADVPITVPIKKCDGLLYGPVRFLAENLGFGVEWDPETGDVTINDGKGPADLNEPYTVVAVTASEDDGNKPINVTDRDYQTRWSAETSGAYITLELDGVHPVAYVGVAAYNGEERQTTLSVQVSKDGVNYQEVVTKWLSSTTVDMEPIDLGGVHDAKYVRILGYGNTANAWNSLTEISVYGPYEDGTQPVATDGPGASNLGGELTEEQQAALAKFDTLFDRLDVWFAHLWCDNCGGFNMTISGRDDPNMECGLEMSQYAMSGIRSYTDAYGTLPDSVKQRMIDYIIERQDPETGMFIDKQGPVNDRETARNQASTMTYVNLWKIDLPYVHPSQAASTGTTTDSSNTAVMPDYMATVDTYIDWVKSWNWDGNSWTAGDQTQQSLNYLNLLEESKYEEYKAALMEFLEERQFEDTGYWAPNLDFNAVSGAFKVGLIYSGLKERIPNADKVMETTIWCMENVYPDVAHYVRNPLSLLTQIAGYSTEYSERIKQAITDNIDTFIAWFDQFLAPDGGFAMRHGKSMGNFGGIYSSHQLWEGDVDSTLMILIARKAIYNLMGQKAPLLDFDDNFWKWITGEAEIPLLYEEDYLNNAGSEGGGEESFSVDFQDVEIGTELVGNEFGGGSYGGNSAKIVLDRDRRDGRVLEVTYDGSLSAGPSFTVMGGGDDISSISKIRYLPSVGTNTVVEFDLKVTGEMATSNNFFLNISDAYALNFQGNGTMRIGNRIDASNVAYGGTFANIKANDWYHFRLELQQEAGDFLAKVYIDGELVSTNKNYMNMLTASPGNPYGSIALTWYRAGKGTVYLDNISMTQKS